MNIVFLFKRTFFSETSTRDSTGLIGLVQEVENGGKQQRPLNDGHQSFTHTICLKVKRVGAHPILSPLGFICT